MRINKLFRYTVFIFFFIVTFFSFSSSMLYPERHNASAVFFLSNNSAAFNNTIPLNFHSFEDITVEMEITPFYQSTDYSGPTVLLFDNKKSNDSVQQEQVISLLNVDLKRKIQPGDIIINEVELNRGSGANGTGWIEIYNTLKNDINIGGFNLITYFQPSTKVLPDNTTIKSESVMLVPVDFGKSSIKAETISIEDISGMTIDSTPSLADTKDDTRTWQRIPDGNDQWRFLDSTANSINISADDTTNKLLIADKDNSNFQSAQGQDVLDENPEGINNGRDAYSAINCLTSENCQEGIVVRVSDGDTLYLKVQDKLIKTDLALVTTPSKGESDYNDAYRFTRDLCLGNKVLVNLNEEGNSQKTESVIYCSIHINLNKALVDNGYGSIDKSQCQTSEFANQAWAKVYGC